jgi:hypothetical protein
MGTKYKKKGKNNKTKRKKKGGSPFGIIPVVTYNEGDNRLVEVTVQNKLDTNAYADRNRVYPVVADSSSLFDYNNIYDKTIGFFTRPDLESSDQPVTRTVKIGINSEKDMEKIAVLNKMIRRYNLLSGLNRRKKGMVGGGIGDNDLLQSLNFREAEIARKLIDGGVLQKVLNRDATEPALTPVENEHAELLKKEELVEKELQTLRAQPPKSPQPQEDVQPDSEESGSYYIRPFTPAKAPAASAPSASAPSALPPAKPPRLATRIPQSATGSLKEPLSEAARKLDESNKQVIGALESQINSLKQEFENDKLLRLIDQIMLTTEKELIQKTLTSEITILTHDLDTDATEKETARFQSEITKNTEELNKTNTDFDTVSAQLQVARTAWEAEKPTLTTEQQQMAENH